MNTDTATATDSTLLDSAKQLLGDLAEFASDARFDAFNYLPTSFSNLCRLFSNRLETIAVLLEKNDFEHADAALSEIVCTFGMMRLCFQDKNERAQAEQFYHLLNSFLPVQLNDPHELLAVAAQLFEIAKQG